MSESVSSSHLRKADGGRFTRSGGLRCGSQPWQTPPSGQPVSLSCLQFARCPLIHPLDDEDKGPAKNPQRPHKEQINEMQKQSNVVSSQRSNS